MTFKIGMIVNPYAGIGGSVGLKGSDGDDIRTEAFRRGAEQRAPQRMQRCLEKLKAFSKNIDIFCFAGAMGEFAARDAGFACTVIGEALCEPSNGNDTNRAVLELLKQSIDVLLFAGGDGTARNIADALQEANAQDQVVLGVPSGVKMHSGVYAISPEAAGDILINLIKNKIVNIDRCDVRDIDENAFREGKVKTRLYGSMLVPVLPNLLQQVKNSGAAQDEMVKLDIANSLIDSLTDETLYVVGPGSTTYVFLQQLGLQGTLLGVDVIHDRELLASDVSARQLQDIIQEHAGPIELIITAIGGQGHIIGRGNQQITPEILRLIGRKNIRIVATKEKIMSLDGRPLVVDSNDADLDREFSGYQTVLVGYNESILYPIGITQTSGVDH